jgi:hypothetical protein
MIAAGAISDPEIAPITVCFGGVQSRIAPADATNARRLN